MPIPALIKDETHLPAKQQKIASWVHLAGYLAIIAGVTFMGFRAQKAGLDNAPAGQLINHSQVIKQYVISILADWALMYYCWVGVHWHGGTLKTLTGDRWASWKEVFIDLAIAFPFWVIWEATAYGVYRLLGPDTARSVAAFLPQSLPEILLWVLVCLTAGFCEEIQSRGYLQSQFHALSGSIVVAAVGQGVLFGLMHTYKGWKQVIVISALGVLYGALAAWRRNLRANMIVHAWSDVWEGWLKMVVFR